MSVNAGPDTIESGLVFTLDAANSKSYPGSGTTWTDISGGGNIGTLAGGPIFSTTVGGIISFDGSNDIVTIPNNVSLDTQTPTVEVWVRTNATCQNGFWFEKGAVNTQYSLFQEGVNITWRQYFTTLPGINSLVATTATYMNTSNWYK